MGSFTQKIYELKILNLLTHFIIFISTFIAVFTYGIIKKLNFFGMLSLNQYKINQIIFTPLLAHTIIRFGFR